MTEMIKTMVQAMAAKRRELIAQPLDRVWPELAKVAIETLMTPTDRMMQVGEAFSDFVLPEGFVNDPQGRVEHLTMAYRVALETALEDPISTAESPATGDNRRRARRIRNC